MRLIDADELMMQVLTVTRTESNARMLDLLTGLIADAPTAGWNTGTPKDAGWYWVYAPGYTGGSSTQREHHGGIMFAKWNGKVWSIERCYYNRPGCVKAWMPLPEAPWT